MTIQPEEGGGFSSTTVAREWAIIHNENEVVRVPGSNFSYNGNSYSATFFSDESIETVKEAGFYEVITPEPEISDFQSAQLSTDPWEINHENKTVSRSFVVTNYSWEDIKIFVETKIQNLLDDFAKERNYQSITTLASYYNSQQETYRLESIYGTNLRDSVWAEWDSFKASVDNNERNIPSLYSEVLSTLPTISWDNF